MAMENRTSRRNNSRLSWLAGLPFRICIIVLVLRIDTSYSQGQRGAVPCVDRNGNPQLCVPEFENAAFELPVEATNTCGDGIREKYCRQTGATGVTKQCSYCHQRNPDEAHGTDYLTDIHEEENMTWWQSQTMFEDIQFPQSVNLTLSLGKSFEITYIRLKFYSPRPESFAIYKKTTPDGPWIPYQYYSGSCEATFGVGTDEIVYTFDETKAICTDQFSDISPLTGGNIAFSTLENRPSAYAFDSSLVLQEWVTATDIKIMLTRLNTFGDEVFRVPDVLRSYYYAISDFSIGGRCKCNGHASSCSMTLGGEYRLVCACEHNTAGPDCGECLPFYNDRPWARATSGNVNECRPCDCKGRSNECYFDQELYEETGSGGHCINCADHTSGVNCERCEDYYYENRYGDCEACNCNPTGSLSLQCREDGLCDCKNGVGGDKCDQCLPDYYDFGPTGCRTCDCVVAGSLDNNAECDSNSGRCNCKDNVEGRTCDRCKTGYFNLQESDRFGCLACFCYGHSSDCTSAPGYELYSIADSFSSGHDYWTAEDRGGNEGYVVYNSIRRDIAVASQDSNFIYFIAPDKYLGDQKASYGQTLSFQLRLGDSDVRLSVEDMVLEGDGITISAPLIAQSNPSPGTIPKRYSFLLREESQLGWVQRPETLDFQRVLANLTALKIRATYRNGGQGFLDNVQMLSVRRASGPGRDEVNFIELCNCPEGYVGQFCESCAGGYRRDPPNGGPYAMCVPCECNGHAELCDVNSGVCICQHNTEGRNCERCEAGYYGNALEGNPDDCQPCPCPGGSECIQDQFGEVICTNCPEGYVGNRCELCKDGYFGDPYGEFGPRSACRRCDCNGNIDSNAVGNCNRTTGECLKCIYNTGGYYCEECLDGYYGDALALPKGQCLACNCYGPGSESFVCDKETGQCDCLRNVETKDCSTCREGYWDIDSGDGCQSCDCDRTGSLHYTCEEGTGQCQCREGVTGQQCDECEYDHYGFSLSGCTPCDCNPQGSKFSNCTEEGACICEEGVIGDKCDSCEENFYNIALGCVPCPVCYNLVQDRVDEHRRKLDQLRRMIADVGSNPQVVSDEDFEGKLLELEKDIDKAIVDLETAVDNDDRIKANYDGIMDMWNMLQEQIKNIRGTLKEAMDNADGSQQDQDETFEIIDRAKDRLADAQNLLDSELARLGKIFNETAQNMSEQDRKMQQLAEEARMLAKQQLADTDGIQEVAQMALNTSKEALDAVQNFTVAGDVESELSELEQQYTELADDALEAKQLAQEAKDRAQEAHDMANSLLAKARQPLPSRDTGGLSDDAADIIAEAERIKMEAEMILDQNRDLLDQVAQDSETAAGLLSDGQDLQNQLDLLLAKAFGAKNDALDAKKKGDDTLAEAQDIRDTLLDFNQQVAESKEKAESAMDRIPAIKANIAMANETAHSANETIEAAQGDAMEARDIAHEARDSANNASAAAENLKTEAEGVTADARLQNDRADDLTAAVNATMMRLNAIDEQAQNDSALAQEASLKANDAQKASSQAQAAVQGALDQVDGLIAALNDTEEIDMEAIVIAKDDFGNLNYTYVHDLDVEGILDRMRRYQTEQEEAIRQHELDLEEVRKQVQNIEDIRDSLPDFCPREKLLEVP